MHYGETLKGSMLISKLLEKFIKKTFLKLKRYFNL